MTSAFGTCPVQCDSVVADKRAHIVWRVNALAAGDFQFLGDLRVWVANSSVCQPSQLGHILRHAIAKLGIS